MIDVVIFFSFILDTSANRFGG